MMTRLAAFQDEQIDLHRATAQGDLESVHELISEGHPIDTRDAEGYTPFLLACKQVEPDIFHALMEAGADLDATNSRGMDGLFLVSTNGVVSMARALIQLGADVNRPATRGLTPLIAAIMSENANLVRLLVASGANVQHTDASGTSVLRWARKLGTPEMLELLRNPEHALDEPAKPLQADDLARAARIGDVELIHECLAMGLSVDALDSDGYTPLMLASRQHKRAAIELLLEAGASPYIPSPNGLTPLLLASSSSIALRPYAESGIDLNDAGSTRGTTPLMYAARHGYVDVVKFLLSTCVDPLVEDREGLSAIDHAHANGHRRIAHLLRDAMI